ncbi:1-phosphofructokinase [[Pseudopropionibacterium] massiliense]|uniref:1-phosphofructokinase n=1 Tax=[Pseudopropionibacterium] massiliense TaxID=2220000 RepID=UPI0010312936|nr:1-phosphofructokinase [[Pseudopropionibacterium] massiliense]
MIVTLTPNPSIDRTVLVENLLPGEVNRAASSRIDPGGKGVNVAHALIRNGHPARAVLPLGGPDGELLARLLQNAGVPFDAVPIAGTTRTNIAIVDPTGVTTKVNEPGPALSPDEVERLGETAGGATGPVVLCGSLPPGTDDSFLARMIARHPGRVVVDTSGAPLAAAVAARPWLIKPNREELSELTSRELPTLSAVVDAARELVAGGIGVVVVSLGSDGALWVDPDVVHHAKATVTEPRSTVGAGDCLLAGVLSSLTTGGDPATALSRGVAWGAAAVALPGSAMPGPEEIAAVAVTSTPEPDLNTVLTG